MLSAMFEPDSRRSVVRTALLIPCLLALAAPGAPQGGGRTAEIKFRAFTGDGSPVPDLTPDDVVLRVEGKPREILSLAFVDLRAGSGASPSAPDIEPPFTTNAENPAGRDIYVVVDEESIAPGRDAAVKEAASVLVETLLPRDRAALVSVRQGGPNLGLTDEHGKVREAIASLAGYANTRETTMDLTCRTSRTIQVLQGLFTSVPAAAPPPLVVFLSTGVAALQSGKMVTLGRAEGSAADLCLIQTEHYQRLGAAAQNANVAFFALELLDASASARLPEATGGLEDLAGATGGEFARVGANLKDQMSRIAQSTSTYYVATFAPDASDRSGGARRVEITLARGGAHVKAPRELALPTAAGRKGSPPTPRDMIRVATPFRELKLRAAAYSSRNPGDDKVRILALFEPLEPDTKLRSATIVMYDKAGKNTAQWNAQSSDFAGPTAVAALVVPPGEYRLRVAATDTAGRAGTVDIEMTAALIEAGPIHLGDLVLGKMSDATPLPVMQFQPGEAEALAMIELYGRPAGPLTAYVEVLDKPEGEALQAVGLQPSATKEQDKFVLAAKIPLTDLKPGDYLVRAVVGVQGQEGKVTRTLRKLGS